MKNHAEKPLTRSGVEGLGAGLLAKTREPIFPVERLVSDVALEALCAVAARGSEASFVSKLTKVFGADVPAVACRALREALLGRTLVAPEIEVVTSGLGGHEAGYDNARRTILVDRRLLSEAERDKSRAAVLLIALVEEFGHHVDNLLRTEYSDQGGDGPRDEGAEFAHALFFSWQAAPPSGPFATFVRAGRVQRLSTDSTSFKKALQRHTGEQERASDEKAGPIQFFGAGRGHGKLGQSFGHESIEDALKQAFPHPKLRRQIYFGNWLRDHSQAIDPALVRPATSSNIAEGFTRIALTRVLDVMAREEFGNDDMYRLTPEKLGVYRAEEHIDNPHGIEDHSRDDKDFRKKWTEAEVSIDPETGLLNYIANRKGVWVTSSAYVEKELRAAAALGMTPEGMRLLGNALHTLEDLYSHSNFAELLLLKLGHTQVYPWAHRKVQTPTVRYPLVTGKFGSNDIQVSLAYVLNENLTATKEYVPGKRSASAEILLILLKDLPPEYLDQKQVKRLEMVMNIQEGLSKKYPQVGRVLDDLSKLMSALPNSILSAQAMKHATNVTKSQEEFLKNPSFLHPTHSQLSKDHDDHPLHLLSATLAMKVVREVGGLMAEVWNGQRRVEEVVRNALKYFVHPEDIQNTATDRRAWVFELARQWARMNPAKLQLLEKGAIIDRQFTKAKRAEACIRSRSDEFGAPDVLLARVRDTLQGVQGLA
ncbi:HET-C-related protein [Melittangium boletus]|uniref:Heterokaryon incompatibility protein Het-C n=1 Tax=Melittangium boletus DSM 14713 TaxID=1294270 RepID=A0A250II35_9BACT|nr:HET-C-related protein [Melittangium boletus]ATB30817.1 hypothetical protein MEBOL_004279 [Melittangium boletus DSM 14713]